MAESETYHKNTKEQYEALGRFVEGFEAMVDEVRTCSVDIIASKLNPFQKTLIAVSFFHPGTTAKHLYDIFIALISKSLQSDFFRKDGNIEREDVPLFASVLSQVNSEYEELCKKRNGLLHGTWYVGYQDGADPDSGTFHVSRFSVGGKGLVPLPMPKTAAELQKLTARCDEVRNWIATAPSQGW